MKKLLIISGCMLHTLICNAQNLVPNGDFEYYNPCPTALNQLPNAIPWLDPAGGSPDYFNQCSGFANASVPYNNWGYQPARSGNGYSGILLYIPMTPDYREYIEVPLTTPLVAGECYYFEMFVSRGNLCRYTVNDIQVYFSNTLLSGIFSQTNLSYPYQIDYTGPLLDSSGWMPVNGIYTAIGGESYILIGNFRNDSATNFVQLSSTFPHPSAYAYIDDVSLTPCAMQLNFTADQNICPGSCVDFTNLSTNAVSYQWVFNGASPSSSTDPNPGNICYTNPGAYDVTLIATNAFGTDTLLMPGFMNVFPQPPIQSIIQQGDTLFANQGAAGYQWYFNGNLIPGAVNYFHVADSSGDYNVIATDTNGCEVEAAIFNVLAYTQSTGDIRQLTIYPNPVSTELIIKNEQLLNGSAVDISVYNMLGERILAVQPLTRNLKPQTLIDVSLLKPGCYFLELNFGERKFRERFIKQ